MFLIQETIIVAAVCIVTYFTMQHHIYVDDDDGDDDNDVDPMSRTERMPHVSEDNVLYNNVPR